MHRAGLTSVKLCLFLPALSLTHFIQSVCYIPQYKWWSSDLTQAVIHSGRHLCSPQRMSRSFHSCTLLRNHLAFSPESSGNGQLQLGGPDSLSVHQNPHHLISERALSLPYIKGGHRWSLASHTMGVTSTKCCCSSCVRNVPYGVNVLSRNCSRGSRCHWAQPCISVLVLLFP